VRRKWWPEVLALALAVAAMVEEALAAMVEALLVGTVEALSLAEAVEAVLEVLVVGLMMHAARLAEPMPAARLAELVAVEVLGSLSSSEEAVARIRRKPSIGMSGPVPGNSIT